MTMEKPRTSRQPQPEPRGPLRVALISFDFGPYCASLANALAEHGEVLLAMPESVISPYRAKLDHAVQLFAFPRSRIRQVTRQYGAIQSILRRVREFAPDVIHYQGVHLWFDLALPLFRRYPLVITIHDFRPHPGDQTLQQTPFWIEMFARRRADHLIVHTQQVRDLLIRKLPDRAGRVSIIPHIRVGDPLDTPEPQEEEKLVLFFGRIWEYKGLEYLIRAEPLITARVPDARILIAGQGEDFARYRRMMLHPDKFIVHNEYIPEQRAAEYFRRAAVVVLPYTEASQSGVIPLAYSAGKPVVATRVGGLPEMVEHGRTGYLVAPRNVAALAESVTRLLLDPELRHEMGATAKKKIGSECSPSVIALRTLEVYLRSILRTRSLRQKQDYNPNRVAPPAPAPAPQTPSQGGPASQVRRETPEASLQRSPH
jgi:glycosyltransferase involved in cell wall biosynthesis